jgi:hypothetical protein
MAARGGGLAPFVPGPGTHTGTGTNHTVGMATAIIGRWSTAGGAGPGKGPAGYIEACIQLTPGGMPPMPVTEDGAMVGVATAGPRHRPLEWRGGEGSRNGAGGDQGFGGRAGGPTPHSTRWRWYSTSTRQVVATTSSENRKRERALVLNFLDVLIR